MIKPIFYKKKQLLISGIVGGIFIKTYRKKMKQVKVNVGNKSYICDLLESEEDRRKGLMGVENLP